MAPNGETKISQLLDNYRTICILGAGGVGKTTMSVLLSLLAVEKGKRVALLSIDPAKRLADALGISLGSEVKEIDLGLKGSLHGAMIDQKAIFDDMVKRHSKDPALTDKILRHPLYVAASTNLSGPLEYMAVSKLKDLIENDEFDTIILDTPPDTHALEFLKRPNVLAGFKENKVMSWLIKPFAVAGKVGAGKFFSAGEKLMGGVAKVTGFSALHQLAEFMVLMQEVIDGFQSSSEVLSGYLHDDKTAFCMVNVASQNSYRSADFLVQNLSKLGFKLNLVIVNKVFEASRMGSGSKKIEYMSETMARRFGGEQDLLQAIQSRWNAELATLHESDSELASVQDLLSLAHKIKS